MFKKSLAHQSNVTPLRSSARRQLVTLILAQYPSFLPPRPDVDRDEEDQVFEKELGRVIVPEGVRIGTIETSGGVEGTLYFSPEGDPIWMSFGRDSKELIPTLYLLAHPLPHPPLPVLQIHNPLPRPILTGAPLFIPALRNLLTPWLLPDIPEGAVVAFVTSEGNAGDVSYVGVGRIAAPGGLRGAVERRKRHLQTGVDADEGKLAEILCIVGDHLWEMGSKPILPTFPLPPQNPLAPPPSPEAGPSRPVSPAENLTDGDQNLDLADNEPNGQSSTPLEPSDISTLLSVALLQALATLQNTSFPMPASLLYSAHVLTNRPAYIPKDTREDVAIAKSEWKKLAKWMKEVAKDGLLKIKETKGEVVVQGFDPQHPSLQNHSTFSTISEEETKDAKRAARQVASQNGDVLAKAGGKGKGKGKEILIEELWKPSGGAVSFWEAAGVDKAALHLPSLLKAALNDYITSHSLVHPSEPRFILLDEELGRAVGVKRPDPGQTMARDEIMRILLAGVSWSTSIGGAIKKGTLQPITLTVKTRQGRRTVTHVTGLETFSVEIDEFAEELRKICAGSASVQPLQGASPKLQLHKIVVQGSQVKIITDALVARGVPKRWIKEGEGDRKKK